MMNLSRFIPGRSEPAEPEFDPHDVEELSQGDWEDVLARFTEDMDPWAIDIVELANRYKSYIEKLERFDLDVPGRVILVGAILLRMKADVLHSHYHDGGEPDEDAFEEEAEQMEEMFDFDEDDLDPVDDEQLRIPESVPQPPVKKKGKRKVTLDELKGALEKALEIDKKRETRQEERKTADDYGIDVEQDDITDRLGRLYDRLRNLTGNSDSTTFSDMIEQEEREEVLEEFVHLMHLETDEKVRCRQDEWLGEIEITILDTPPEEAA